MERKNNFFKKKNNLKNLNLVPNFIKKEKNMVGFTLNHFF
jgi:hypothetical protein